MWPDAERRWQSAASRKQDTARPACTPRSCCAGSCSTHSQRAIALHPGNGAHHRRISHCDRQASTRHRLRRRRLLRTATLVRSAATRDREASTLDRDASTRDRQAHAHDRPTGTRDRVAGGPRPISSPRHLPTAAAPTSPRSASLRHSPRRSSGRPTRRTGAASGWRGRRCRGRSRDRNRLPGSVPQWRSRAWSIPAAL